MAKNSTWVALTTIAVLHAIILFMPPTMFGAYFVVVRPLVYLALSLFCFMFIEKNKQLSIPNGISTPICVFGLIFFMLLMFALGIVFGFGYNPMSNSVELFAKNLWTFVIMAALREYLRGVIVKQLHSSRVSIVFVMLIFSFCFIDNIRMIYASQSQFLNMLLHTILPMIVLNYFLTFIALRNNSVGNITFMCAYQLIYYISPALPNAPKMLEGAALCLSVFVMYIFYDVMRLKSARNHRHLRKYPWKALAMTSSIGITLILFVFGIFPYYPMVVVSNSMKGVFSRGDVVIIRKIGYNVASTELKKGDIICYTCEDDDKDIVHRIIEVLDTGTERKYRTKGDDNPVADSNHIAPIQIKGVYSSYVPYIGLPTLKLTMR